VQNVATYPVVRAVRRLGVLRKEQFDLVGEGLLRWLGYELFVGLGPNTNRGLLCRQSLLVGSAFWPTDCASFHHVCTSAAISTPRQRQRHDANRRYQQSEPGGECHCRCQKCYRERALRTPVKIMVRWRSLRRHLPRGADCLPVHDLRSTQPLDRSISGLQKSVWIRCPSHSPTDTSAIVQTGCID
jgi:hypothetical protein